MSISLDCDVAEGRDVIAPLQEILEKDALIKTVTICARFQAQEPRFMWWGGFMSCLELPRSWSVAYFPTELIPESDLDLFNYLRAIETMPIVQAQTAAYKEKASPEQLKKIEEWQDQFQMPIESEKVQTLLSDTRLQAEQAVLEKQQRELQKIANTYNQTVKEMNRTPMPKNLSEITIVVTFAKQANFNHHFTVNYRATDGQVGQWSVEES